MVNLQERAEGVALRTANFFGIPVPAVEVKRARKGWCWPWLNKISIPVWAWDNGEQYFDAYVVHEVTHQRRFIVKTLYSHAEAMHGPEFHADERRALAFFGLVPVYNRVYIRELRTLSGETVYRKKSLKERVEKYRAVQTAKVPRVRKPTALEIILAD